MRSIKQLANAAFFCLFGANPHEQLWTWLA
jgi:hypothetical protein